MTNFEDKLSAALYRATCPDSMELGEYYLGILVEDRSGFVRQHLAECPHCSLELSQLESFARDTSPDLEPSLAERVKVWIARLVPESPSAPSGIEPALALRGDDQGPLFYEAGDVQLTIEIQDDPDEPGRRTLLGLVIGIETEEMQAHFWQDGELVATAVVDELGNFIISDLSPGHYELILAAPTVEILVQDLAI
jgi:hypothetical protein